MEFTDRYKALGIPYPDPKTMCQGYCEGTGLVPIHSSETEPKRSPPSSGRWRLTSSMLPASEYCGNDL